MAKNPEWFDQMRARGICYICQRAMADDDPRRAHTECLRAQNQGRTYADIRQAPPELRPVMRLICFFCGKSVSTEVPDDVTLRAVCICPECIPRTIRKDAPPSILTPPEERS